VRFWDSSALVPLLVDEPGSAGRLQELKADPAVLIWWGTPVECESALQRRLREGALDAEGARLARENLMRLAAAWREVPASAVVRTLAVRLLRTHPLRAADALQLAAALSLVQGGVADLVFLTADLRLAEAAEIEGLGVGR
jgi:uncharacterized protein